MSSYTTQTKKPEEILYTDGTVTPTNGVYPTTVVNTGATGGAVTPTTGAVGTSGVLYTDGAVGGAAAGASTAPTDPYGYAEWLKGQSYQNAADTANRARQEAAANKQSAIVGADTAYQQALSNYGANAESLASRGLTNSGYGEYLMGKNYATARAEKAAANATYQGAMSDILYKENSAKLEADKVYADEMIRLDEKKKTDAQSAYDALLLAAQSGTDISALQSDARWALISPEQQAAITAETDKVTRGKTFDEILRNIEVGDYDATTVTSAPGWDTLTDTERDQALDEIRVRDDNIAAGYAKNKNSIITNIKSGNYAQYDDDELSRLVTDKVIDPTDLTDIKQERAKAAIADFESAIDDDESGALKTTRGLNKYLSDIDKLENDKIISKTEADELKNKAYREAFASHESIQIFIADYTDKAGTAYYSTNEMDHYTYTGVKPSVISPDSDIYNKLNAYARKGREVVEFSGKYYVYDNDNWYDVTSAVYQGKNNSSK